MLLNTHSYFSFRYGLLSPDKLLATAQQLGYITVALTDINSTSGCLDFIRQAPRHGITPVVGVDFRNDGIQQCYVALAQNNDGYEQINHFLTYHLHHDLPFPAEAPPFEHVHVIYPSTRVPSRLLRPNEWIGVRIEDLNKMAYKGVRDPSRMVVLATSTCSDRLHYPVHKLLRAIDLNTIYTKVRPVDYAGPTDVFRSRESLLHLYREHSQAVHNTQSLLEQCGVTFDFTGQQSQNLKTYHQTEAEDMAKIRELCHANLSYRYPTMTDQIRTRIDKELEIIAQKGFLSYFLINWDITSYARDRGYFYVGRGSGANSIIAYLLRITDVDPIELDLYFERFINVFRQNPPDFDIDFSWKDREDVTDYIFRRFDHAALLATYNSFKPRAAIRELSKVFGLPKEETDNLIASLNQKQAPRADNQFSRYVLHYAKYLYEHEMPSHLSVHSSGILISHNPLQRYSATWLPPKGFPTTQFDMHVAEDVGLYKFDILGQRGLGKIKDTLSIVADNHPTADPIDIHDLRRFKQDERIKSLLREGNAIGCFYVESPAMRMLLCKLRVDTYLGLVAASSIIRPGVAQSGMMREYILRERDPERRKQAHPILWDIMPDTYGIMVYQEDVIKVAHYYAKLTLGEADVLRRGMSGKYRSREEFLKIQDKYFSNCRELGHPDAEAKEIWRQIESFAGYAFAKGHSASYAVESYQSLFLKAYFPLEYMVATINNGGGFYRAELYAHEARMHGATLHAPCVNQSDYYCTITGTDIYIGLGFIHGIESELAQALVQERQANGPYEDFVSFVDRNVIGLEQLCLLVRMDAFRSLGHTKRSLLWKAHQLLTKTTKPSATQTRLFTPPVKDYQLPDLATGALEETFDQLELLGYPLSNPFDLVESLDQYSTHVRADFPRLCRQVITIVGYLISVKNTKTSRGDYMNFGTFIDLDGHFIDTTHFPPVAAKHPFRGKGIYAITGTVVEEFGFHSIEVSAMTKLPYVTDPRFNDAAYTLRQETMRKTKKSGMVELNA
ncbi:MAG: DNA polymerase III subunit alpha [Bacteroidota bacterium]